MKAWRERASRWLFPAESDTWLTVLRVGLGVHVALYALSLGRDWSYLFARSATGLPTRELSERVLSLETPYVPRIGWFVAIASRLGASDGAVLTVLWLCLVVAGGALAVGLYCRPAAIACWLLHLSAAKSGDFLAYGVDRFMTIGLFYLMLSPLPDRRALDHRRRGKPAGRPELLGFYRRVLQVHVCLIYLYGGLNKCLGASWWTGENLWRALTRPPFDVIAPDVLLHFKSLFPIAGISILVLETCYPLFIGLRKTRRIWLIGVLAMHLGIGLMMGMYSFALVMMILNAAAFGVGAWTTASSSPREVVDDRAPQGGG